MGKHTERDASKPLETLCFPRSRCESCERLTIVSNKVFKKTLGSLCFARGVKAPLLCKYFKIVPSSSFLRSNDTTKVRDFIQCDAMDDGKVVSAIAVFIGLS